jgi:hypothetical protein
MSQKDADRIEAQTGKKPEDLSEEQLETAINELDIETQELTDANVAVIEAIEDEPADPVTPAPALLLPVTSPASDSADYITELKRLAELRDVGIITAEEFEAKKKTVAGSVAFRHFINDSKLAVN